MATETLIKELAVTLEVCGATLSDAAKRILLQDLSEYPEQALLRALAKCRREVKGRIAPIDIISRIDDGRPGSEEAWAMIPRDEATTVVWTAEMSAAHAIASELLEEGDKIGARMAFKEAYARLVSEARDRREPVRWVPSLGLDANGREPVLLDAIEKGRLSADEAAKLLPYHRPSPQWLAISSAIVPLIGSSDDPVPPEEAAKRIRELRDMLKPKVSQ